MVVLERAERSVSSRLFTSTFRVSSCRVYRLPGFTGVAFRVRPCRWNHPGSPADPVRLRSATPSDRQRKSSCCHHPLDPLNAESRPFRKRSRRDHQAESHKHSSRDAGPRRSGARQLYTAAAPAALATRMSFLLATPRRGVSCEPGNPSRLRHIHSMGVVLPSSSLGISPDRKPTRYEHVCCTRPMAPGPP